MAAIAAFAASPEGLIYARICDRWGIDPGAVFSDSVLAFAMRARLMFATAPALVEDEPEPEESEPESAVAANMREWLSA